MSTIAAISTVVTLLGLLIVNVGLFGVVDVICSSLSTVKLFKELSTFGYSNFIVIVYSYPLIPLSLLA